MRNAWRPEDLEILRTMYRNWSMAGDIAHALGRTQGAIESKVAELRQMEGLARKISQPSTKVWDDYVTVEGDALILGDVETPYHHADFVNRCIELATRWGITKVILNGDFVHFANYSSWGADFIHDPKRSDEIGDPEVLAWLEKITDEKERNEGRKLLAPKLQKPPDDYDISTELATVRKTSREIGGAFETVYYVPGNHDNRVLRTLDKPLTVGETLRHIGAGNNWIGGPYYYCVLKTDNPTPYRIEHPRQAGPNAARDLAVQYHTHVIMGHSHRWAVQRDPSGDYWAIQAGHCVDEKRLAYVMQRSAKRDAHALGAVIVRGGYPFVLCEQTPWAAMGKW